MCIGPRLLAAPCDPRQVLPSVATRCGPASGFDVNASAIQRWKHCWKASGLRTMSRRRMQSREGMPFASVRRVGLKYFRKQWDAVVCFQRTRRQEFAENKQVLPLQKCLKNCLFHNEIPRWHLRPTGQAKRMAVRKRHPCPLITYSSPKKYPSTSLVTPTAIRGKPSYLKKGCFCVIIHERRLHFRASCRAATQRRLLALPRPSPDESRSVCTRRSAHRGVHRRERSKDYLSQTMPAA